jgi:hypothetical protein
VFIAEEAEMNRQSIGIGAGLVAGAILTGIITAAPTKVAAPVEVVNFPAVQGVEGIVDVGNFPVVQGVEVHGQVPVAGQVDLSNLPLDMSGNLRVAEQTSLTPAPMMIDARFREADKNASALLPLIELPSGFTTVSVSVHSLDMTQADVSGYGAGFGSGSQPPPTRAWETSSSFRDRSRWGSRRDSRQTYPAAVQ